MSAIQQFEDQALICKSSLNTVGDDLHCFDENPCTEDLALPRFSGCDDDKLDFYGFLDNLVEYMSLRQLTNDEQSDY